MGLNNQLYNWIQAYLYKRRQLVKINSNTISKPVNVTSGVGQGYPIGATLFIMFIFDLTFHVNLSSLHLFADDSKLSKPVSSINDCYDLQHDLNAVTEYFNTNRLKLNVNKTKMITFSRKHNKINHIYTLNNIPIHRVNQINDLGIKIKTYMDQTFF